MKLPRCSWETTVRELRAIGADIPARVTDETIAKCTAVPTQHDDCSITYRLDVVLPGRIVDVNASMGVGHDGARW